MTPKCFDFRTNFCTITFPKYFKIIVFRTNLCTMSSKMNKFVYSLSKILQYVYYVLFKILQKHSSLLSRVVSPAPLFVSTVRFSFFLYTVMIRSSLLHLPPLLRVTLARLFAHGELPASVRSCTLLVLYARSLFGFVQGPAFGRLFQAGVRLPRLLLVTGKLLPEVRGFRRSATLKSVCEETGNASGVHSSIWFPMINSNFEVEERDNEKDHTLFSLLTHISFASYQSQK